MTGGEGGWPSTRSAGFHLMTTMADLIDAYETSGRQEGGDPDSSADAKAFGAYLRLYERLALALDLTGPVTHAGNGWLALEIGGSLRPQKVEGGTLGRPANIVPIPASALWPRVGGRDGPNRWGA
jgi:hypothetical protein